MNFKRVYHPWDIWEEIEFNMWGEAEQGALDKAIEFTSNHKLYGSFMMRVVTEWPISCENALTDRHLNKRAWLGHAACALALSCPEHVVREAWGKLTDEQRILANEEASRAIRTWENDYAASNKLHPDMGGTLL